MIAIFQSVFVLSIQCQAFWLGSYSIFIHNYQKSALHAIAIDGLIINVPVGGGAMPCPLIWLFGVEPVPAQVLHVLMELFSCLQGYPSIRGG